MRNTRTRILSVILTALMLLSVLPMFANAADATTPIALMITDPLVKIEPPAISPAKFDYGLKYGELTYVGGAVYYDGVLVPGTFTCGTRYENRVIPVPYSDSTRYARVYFLPEDTTKFRAENVFAYNATYYAGDDWPQYDVTPIPTRAEGTFPEVTVVMGTALSDITVPADVKIFNANTNADITASGRWYWRDKDGNNIPGYAVTADGEYTIRWEADGHADYSTTMKIKVTMEGYTGLGESPTITPPEYYTPKMTWESCKVEGGTAYVNGELIAGHYIISGATAEVGTSAGKTTGVTVKFVPDDEAHATAFASLTRGLSVTMPAAAIEFAEEPTEIVFPLGECRQTMRSDRCGIKLTQDIGGSVMVKFEADYRNRPVGVYENETITIYSNADKAFTALGSITKVVTLRIIPATTDEAVGKLEAKKMKDGNDENYEISLEASDNGKTGTFTIKVNGEVIAEGVEPTYKEGEAKKKKFFTYKAIETGTYTVTAEYIPGENDGYTFNTPILETSFDAVVRTPRKVTAVGGKSSTETEIRYAGDLASVEATGNTDKFDHWEFTETKTGRALTVEELSSAEHKVTEDMLKQKKVIFVLPDFDVTATAKEKGAIDIPTTPGGDNPGEGGFDFAAIWNAIVQFFVGLKDAPVISWIIRLVDFIINFFTDLFAGLVK